MSKFIKVVSFNKIVLLNIDTISEVYPEEKKVCRADSSILYVDDESMNKLIQLLEAR